MVFDMMRLAEDSAVLTKHFDQMIAFSKAIGRSEEDEEISFRTHNNSSLHLTSFVNSGFMSFISFSSFPQLQILCFPRSDDAKRYIELLGSNRIQVIELLTTGPERPFRVRMTSCKRVAGQAVLVSKICTRLWTCN